MPRINERPVVDRKVDGTDNGAIKQTADPAAGEGAPSAKILRKIKSIDEQKTASWIGGGSSVHGNKLSQRLEAISGNALWYADF